MNPGKHPPGCWLWRQLAIVGLAVCAGCGERLVTIEGNVTFDGQPVEQGTIAFEPAEGQGTTTGTNIEHGRYKLSAKARATPGRKLVRITAVRKTGRQIEVGSPAPPGTMVDEIKRYIPAVYNTKSTLTREVTAGKTNRHDFKLTSQTAGADNGP